MTNSAPRERQPMTVPDQTIYGDLSQHVLDCRIPGCLTCRAHAEMERRGGDVDALRFERDDAHAKLVTLATAVDQRLPQLMHAAALVLRQPDGTPAVAGLSVPRVSDQQFEAIQTRTEQAFERRYVSRRLDLALERLYRIRSVHTRHAARARLTTVDAETRETSLRIVTAIAHAWYGVGWEGDPSAALDVYELEVSGA